jgi:hypothetical protein
MVRYDRGTDEENAKKIAMSNYNMKSEALNIEMELRRSRVFLPINTNTGIYQNTQCTNAHSANKINQFHNMFIYLFLFLLLHHINTKAVTINASVAPPPTKNNIMGGMSCRITPVSNIPPMRSFATSSKNFAASVFMAQKYDKYPNNTNNFQNINYEKN